MGRQDPGPSAFSLSKNLMPKLGTEVATLSATDLKCVDKMAGVGCGPAHTPRGYWPAWPKSTAQRRSPMVTKVKSCNMRLWP